MAVLENINGQANNRFIDSKGGGACNMGCYYRVSGKNLVVKGMISPLVQQLT
jgi:hypothetical protein